MMPVQAIQWKSSGVGGESVVYVKSDYATQVAVGGKEITLNIGWWQNTGSWLLDRFSSGVQLYQFQTPTLEVSVTRQDADLLGLEPGAVVKFSCSTVWNRQGRRGVTDVEALVMTVGKNLHDAAGSHSVNLLLSGYSYDIRVGRWAPSGVITGILTPDTFTVAMDDGSLVTEWFSPGTKLALIEPNGAYLDEVCTVTVNTITSVTVSGLDFAPTVGDRFELSPYTDAVYPNAGYLSRGYQYV